MVWATFCGDRENDGEKHVYQFILSASVHVRSRLAIIETHSLDYKRLQQLIFVTMIQGGNQGMDRWSLAGKIVKTKLAILGNISIFGVVFTLGEVMITLFSIPNMASFRLSSIQLNPS